MACSKYRIIFCLAVLIPMVTPQAYGDIQEKPKTPLVFIHGIKGSKLADGQGKLHWLNFWQGLSLSTPQLKLPLEWNTENVQAQDELKPQGVLDVVSLIPGFIESSVYGKWLEATKQFSRPIYTFAYDWRRDNLESLAQFKLFIQDLYKTYGKIQIVAHSMGGLISLALLNESPELIHSLFFVGVPFRGGIGFLPDLTEGTATGFNDKILNPDVLGSFPSVYTLFPLDGPKLVFNEEAKPIDADFFSVDDWERNAWGLFRNSNDRDEKRKFLSIALERAKSFRQRLVRKNLEYPPITVVYGNTLASIVNAKRLKKGTVISWDFESMEKCKGDGRVCQEDAQFPGDLKTQVYVSQFEHSALLDDPKLISLIRESVNESH